MQIKQTHRVILIFLLYIISRGEPMIVKKISICLLFLSVFLLCNSTNAIEDSNGYVGIQMYKFKKPRIAKEITIINVFPNSPAWNVGIRTADRILKVNDIDVSDKALDEVQKLISGKVNSNVKLTLKTRYGIKDFVVTRAVFNPNNNLSYPQWKEFCGNKQSEHEACFIHEDDVIKKFIEFGCGPYYVSTVGRNLAQQRYTFENNLYLCGKTKDPAMCYIQLRQNMQNQIFANQSMQQQATQNLIQNLNNVNTNIELQNMNQNLYNINNSIQMLRY